MTIKQTEFVSEPAVAIVVGQFNGEITSLLLEGAVTYLEEQGLVRSKIKVVKVPGAIEIPLAAKCLAYSKKYQALICLGAVIRGETNHYDYVCSQVSEGCRQVMMAYDLPVIFGVLTTENEDQARERVGGRHGHKGREAAEAALAMIAVMQTLERAT